MGVESSGHPVSASQPVRHLEQLGDGRQQRPVPRAVWAVRGSGRPVVLGAVRASQGVWWRYPLSIRFVRGASKRNAEAG